MVGVIALALVVAGRLPGRPPQAAEGSGDATTTRQSLALDVHGQE